MLFDEFCKFAGYTINIQRSIAFLYIHSEQSERVFRKKEIKEGGGDKRGRNRGARKRRKT